MQLVLPIHRYGRTGYSFIEETLFPYLERHGVTKTQIKAMMVGKAARVLTFVAPQAPKLSAARN